MADKEPIWMRRARSQFWNYWHSLNADERRRNSSTVLLKGWMAHAEHMNKKETESA
jgi:hypothetical protein